MLQIVLGTEMERYWFDTRIRRLLDESLARCGPTGMRFEFVVDPAEPTGCRTELIRRRRATRG